MSDVSWSCIPEPLERHLQDHVFIEQFGEVAYGTRAITVTAKVRDINTTSKVVDDAITAGGNDVQVQNIAFTIDNPDDLKKQARQAAVADAKAKAQTLATESGVTLGSPISISETSAVAPIPFDARAGAAAGAAPSTPIEPGTQDVTVDVSVTWSIK